MYVLSVGLRVLLNKSYLLPKTHQTQAYLVRVEIGVDLSLVQQREGVSEVYFFQSKVSSL